MMTAAGIPVPDLVGAQRPAAVDVRSAVESALYIAKAQIRGRAKLVVDLRNVPPVLGIQGRLMVVVLSLLMNSVQAIPRGNIAENEIRVSTRYVDDGYVVIEVRDTGCGIPQELTQVIFEPSTCGLSISNGIVASFGGSISVARAVPHGAIFSVCLPTDLNEKGTMS